jgi:hypothetical protein
VPAVEEEGGSAPLLRLLRRLLGVGTAPAAVFPVSVGFVFEQAASWLFLLVL